MGLAAGTILGMAAGLFLQSKRGKQISKDAMKSAQVLQKRIMKKLDGVEELTKDKYEEVVDHVLEYYTKTKEVAQKELPQVRAFLLSQWKAVQAKLAKDEEGDEE